MKKTEAQKRLSPDIEALYNLAFSVKADSEKLEQSIVRARAALLIDGELHVVFHPIDTDLYETIVNPSGQETINKHLPEVGLSRFYCKIFTHAEWAEYYYDYEASTGIKLQPKPIYSEKLKTKQWLEKRDFILRRDGYQCKVCGKNSGLHVHHILYDGEPWEVPDNALITLCPGCHKKAHKIPHF